MNFIFHQIFYIDFFSFLMCLKHWKLIPWMLLGTLFVVSDALWAPFFVSKQLLGPLFLTLDAPWGTLWHQMGSRTDFFRFGMPVGLHFRRFLGVRVGSGRSFGSLLVPFGRPSALVFGFCVGNRETMKSVVLLKKNLCFEGSGRCWLDIFLRFFSHFGWLEGECELLAN